MTRRWLLWLGLGFLLSLSAQAQDEAGFFDLAVTADETASAEDSALPPGDPAVDVEPVDPPDSGEEQAEAVDEAAVVTEEEADPGVSEAEAIVPETSGNEQSEAPPPPLSETTEEAEQAEAPPPPPTLPLPNSLCDASKPRSLDGTCNNLVDLEMGSASNEFIFIAGQQYKRGPDEVVEFFNSEVLRDDDNNGDYAMEPPEGLRTGGQEICSPRGLNGRKKCTRRGVLRVFRGLGPTLSVKPRRLSQVLHGVLPARVPGSRYRLKQVFHPTISRLLPYFAQFVAHDYAGEILRDHHSVDVSEAGLPDMDDMMNPAVRTGISLGQRDLFLATNPILRTGEFAYPTAILEGPVAIAHPDPSAPGLVDRIDFLNLRTAWLDLDAIYGQDDVLGDYLRGEKKDGLLALVDYELKAADYAYLDTDFVVKGLPPPRRGLPLNKRGFVDKPEDDFVPFFGDERNGENLPMGIMHLAFTRFHNHLASTTCKTWYDETVLTTPVANLTAAAQVVRDEEIFQCARSLNIAAFQHIVLDEFLPVVLGPDPLEPYTGYNDEIDGNIAAEADIAFRLHTVIPRDVPLAFAGGFLDERCNMGGMSFGPQLGNPPPGHLGFAGVTTGGTRFPVGSWVYNLGFSGFWGAEDPYQQVIRGLVWSACPDTNEEVDDMLRHVPFALGIDVPSATVLRQDQLGVGTYMQVRAALMPDIKPLYGTKGCPKFFKRFKRLRDPFRCFKRMTGSSSKARRLVAGMLELKMVPKLTNIPLWTGLQYERRVAGGLFGVLQAEIIRDQMRRLRDGDRHFYKRVLSADDVAKTETLTLTDILKTAFGEDLAIHDQALLRMT